MEENKEHTEEQPKEKESPEETMENVKETTENVDEKEDRLEKKAQEKIEEKKQPKAEPRRKEKRILKPGIWKSLCLILAALFIVSLLTNNFSFNELSKEEVAEKTMEYINKNLVGEGQEVEFRSLTEEKGLYVLKLGVNGREVDSYVTKGGELLFTQVIDMGKEIKQPEGSPTAAVVADVIKSAQPKVELFIMDLCPFGLQASKGILPVVEQLGDKIDFSLKFVYYAMHGKEEIDEQLNQVCIQEEQRDKFLDYFKCFLEEGKGEECLSKTEIDKEKLKSCVNRIDNQYQITQKFNDRSTWLSGRYPLFDVHKVENEQYQVKGSPTLVINGQTISSERSAAAYLRTICASFDEAPEECKSELSSAVPSAGFGYQNSGATNTGSCG